MSHALLAQDWITVRGSLTTTGVIQGDESYTDIARFQDVATWTEVSDVAGSPTLRYETSPTRDDVLFQLFETAASFVPVVGVTVKVFRFASATAPPARYFRWKIPSSGTAPWSLTFRIWLVGNVS